MKTLIDIDNILLEKAIQLSHAATKKETIHLALKELIKLKLRGQLKEMAGSGLIEWSLDDLKGSRHQREGAHRLIRNGK